MPLPTRAQNPTGLHQRYTVAKTDGTPTDPDAVYLVLRIDGGGRDRKHIEACRAAADVYAAHAIEIPGLGQVGADLQDLLDKYRVEEAV